VPGVALIGRPVVTHAHHFVLHQCGVVNAGVQQRLGVLGAAAVVVGVGDGTARGAGAAAGVAVQGECQVEFLPLFQHARRRADVVGSVVGARHVPHAGREAVELGVVARAFLPAWTAGCAAAAVDVAHAAAQFAGVDHDHAAVCGGVTEFDARAAGGGEVPLAQEHPPPALVGGLGNAVPGAGPAVLVLVHAHFADAGAVVHAVESVGGAVGALGPAHVNGVAPRLGDVEV